MKKAKTKVNPDYKYIMYRLKTDYNQADIQKWVFFKITKKVFMGTQDLIETELFQKH